MLSVFVTEKIAENAIYGIDGYFSSVWEPEWIDNDFAREVIRDIDKSEVVAPRIIDSPFLGYTDPTSLSGGVKCILCMMFDTTTDWIFNISVCGDNCAKWIQEVGAKKDILVHLGYPMKMSGDKFPIKIVNSGKLVYSPREFILEYLEVV